MERRVSGRRELATPALGRPWGATGPVEALQLIRGEAVEQAVASGAPEVVLAATAVGTARRMRRVPRLGGRVVAQSLAVDVADHRGALGAARPIATGSVLSGRKCS